ncbi:hypothetical protein BDN72DRAFT_864627 [Pluteus cervinus]|uniref:Uncharacterized protein n=1 Tax=Pluteus cervinus TaxID=181527 RepID=A0ACD3A477_9AGAR|nr:hypothetical protein BDN72DRAFT_864627 [Pluteus cervinus]
MEGAKWVPKSILARVALVVRFYGWQFTMLPLFTGIECGIWVPTSAIASYIAGLGVSNVPTGLQLLWLMDCILSKIECGSWILKAISTMAMDEHQCKGRVLQAIPAMAIDAMGGASPLYPYSLEPVELLGAKCYIFHGYKT